jgi:hypothetical protein
MLEPLFVCACCASVTVREVERSDSPICSKLGHEFDRFGTHKWLVGTFAGMTSACGAPLSINRRRRISRRLSVLAFGGILAGSVIAPTGADATSVCGARTLTKSFSRFGDQNDYFVPPSGDFEGSLSGWTLNGATVVSENEPWKIYGSSHSKSLSIPAGGKIVSKPICLGTNEDLVRMMIKLPNNNSAVRVTVTAQAANGKVSTVNAVAPGGVLGWRVSNQFAIPGTQYLTGPMTTVITIESTGSTAILVDSVSIDPWKTR